MSANFNRVILVGNVTREVDLRFTQNDTAVTEIGLAVNQPRTNSEGERTDDVLFVDVTLWGRTAEIADQYLEKGSSVLIEGRLKLETWDSDGQKRSKLRVIGERMQMLGAPSGNGKGKSKAKVTGASQSAAAAAVGEDAPPF